MMLISRVNPKKRSDYSSRALSLTKEHKDYETDEETKEFAH